MGFDLIAEDVSNHGQCDLTLRHGGKTWLIEFKLIEGVEPTGKALAQFQAKNDAAKYDGPATLGAVCVVPQSAGQAARSASPCTVCSAPMRAAGSDLPARQAVSAGRLSAPLTKNSTCRL